ncbi:MAG: D-methionine transport system substrate-binding protein [Candidatus Tokpelaia sp. JSC085]|nr:MAG: D-methionine transport system substrate-binding protein [Candidatus Tokpelaia sp. JSC085]
MRFRVGLHKLTILTIFFSAILSAIGIGMPILHAVEHNPIKLGVMGGDEEDVWKIAVDIASKQGLHIELVPFSDYSIINEALSAGDIDANAMQHKPYFDAQLAQHGYKLSIIGHTALFPIGVYSRKVKNLDELRDGAIIGIPDDPSNEGRALQIMAQAGLITLKTPNAILATPLDIKDNPKKLKFQEMNSGIVGRAIADFDAVIVNNTWITSSGINPDKELIALEKIENNPYDNIIVVRTEDVTKPWAKKLVAAYQNDSVRNKLQHIFGKTFATSW